MLPAVSEIDEKEDSETTPLKEERDGPESVTKRDESEDGK